jgi:glutamate synthase domain-containing protein 2
MRRATWALPSAAASALAAVAAHDVLQKQHALLRNYPVVGRARKLLETIGPELRQYIVASNNEERPFTRDQRRWVYASAKKENNYFGFGTDNDVEYTAGYPIIKHRTFGRAVPLSSPGASHAAEVPCAKVLGAARRREKAFRPPSVVNVSAMSFGSLSGNAIEALNRGAALAGCLQNTGEGGVSPYHRKGGSWSSRSARPTSAAATRTAASTCAGSRTSSPPRRCGARDQAQPGRQAGLGASCPVRRCRRRSRRRAACGRAGLHQPVAAREFDDSTACSTG